MAYLVIQLEGKPPTRRRLKGDVEIGRGIGAEVWIHDSEASRQHCRIHRNGDQWMIDDLKSRNGTFINGKKVSSQLLLDGEVIQIGTTRIIFHNSDLAEEHPVRPVRPTDLSDSQRIDLHGTTALTHIDRPLPKVSVEQTTPDPHDYAKRSIAFQRPPAQPILPPKPVLPDPPKRSWWQRIRGK